MIHATNVSESGPVNWKAGHRQPAPWCAWAMPLALLLVTAGALESATAEQTINENLNVVGRTEIGDDAGSTAFFGTDTLRLSGERVRLKFIDTSASGTTSDWRIRINTFGSNNNGFFIDDMGDNNNDGAENAHLSTPFKIQAGAGSNSLVISRINKPGDTGSRIGLGTDAPTAALHLVNGSVPSIRLERNDAIDTPYIWALGGASETFFLRDVTAGSQPFTVDAGAPDNSLVVANLFDGFAFRIGLGIETPLDDLHIAGGAQANILLDHAGSAHDWRIEADNYFSIENVDNANAPFFIQSGAPDLAFGIEQDGDIGIGDLTPDADLDIQRGSTFSRVNAGDTNFTTSSSRSLKENIQPVQILELLAKMANVPVNTYDWKPEHFSGDEADRTDKLGLIAEDFHTILGRGTDKEIKGQDVQMVLWMAVQELHRENQQLKAQLEQQVSDTQSRLERLERQLSAVDQP